MIEQRVTLRYGAQQIPAIVQAVQGDTGRDVIFELADYEIPAGATANYYIDKPDDTAIYNSAEVISSTEILAHLTEQALAAPGRNNGQVRILSDDEVITSFDFVLEVMAFRGILHMQSETEVNIFDQAIEEAVAEIQAQTPVVTGMQNSIAPTYSASSTYAVGDYVMYNATLYRCTTAITTAEAWTVAHWTQVPLGSDVTDLKSALDGGFIEIDFVFTDGGYISASNGNLVEYAHWKYTDYIDISNRDSDVIYAFTTAPDNRYYNAYYDKNKTFISSFTVDNAEITVPDNTVFVRMSVQEAYSCGIKIYDSGVKDDILDVKDSVFSDSYFIKSQLEFEAGGILTSSGHDYDGSEQKNRLRSKFAYADREYTLFQSESLPSGGVFIWYKVFYWDDSDFTKNVSSQSNWFRFPDTPNYIIPKGSYFRVLIYSEQYPDPITDVKFSFVYQHFDIGVTINNEDLDENGIITLNKEVLPFVQSMPTSYPENAKTYFSATHEPLSFAHFSDIHNRPELWQRIAEYVDEYSTYLPFALHTGDYVGDNQTSYTDLYAYYMPSVPFYNCVGNHDTYTDGQHTTATKQSVHEKLFNHISNWDVIFMSGDYSMTYYKDFVDSNVRLIVFDNYYDIATQKTWLTNILSDAKTHGYHVITASHQVTGRPQNKVNCTFETLIPYESAGSGSLLNTEFDAVIGDFINNGGKHIVHLCGHEHTDSFYKTANGVLNYAIECATDYTGWTEGARVPYTKSWDCFNAISVDTELGVLKIVRIGHNVDCFNRAKNILSYDYVNSIVLNNE